MLPCPFGQQRCLNVRSAGIFIEHHEIGVIHLGSVELAIAGTNGSVNGSASIIFPFPLVPHQGGTAEQLVDEFRVRAGTECKDGTQRQIRFRVGTIIAVVTGVIQLLELLTILLFAEIADNIEDCPVAIPACTVFDLFGLAHILVQGCQYSGGAILQWKIRHDISGKGCKAVGQTTDIQFNAVIGILHVELLIQPGFAVFIRGDWQLSQIHLAVNMQAITADGVFRIGIKPGEHGLHSGIVQSGMVDIQKEVSFRDDKTYTGSTDLFRCRYGFTVDNPGVAVLIIGTGRTATGCER